MQDWQETLMVYSQRLRKGFSGEEGEKLGRKERVRVRVLWWLMFGMMGVLVARVLYLSVFARGQYTLLAEGNKIERVRKPAERGIVYDRNGEALVRNVPGKGERGREYLLGASAAHLLGYISEVTADEVGCRRGICYRPGQWSGRSGVEKVAEAVLKGKDGGELWEVDAQGERVRELGANEPESGQDVYLAVEAKMQRAMAGAMGERAGAAVALDMQGKVLGLYSSPAYDPNIFTLYPNEAQKKALLSDEEKKYLLDRAIGGSYPPGSVYKLVTAHAGLAEGKIDRETKIEDTGEIRIDNYRYGNWYFDQYGKTEGEISVERAIGRSNDVFFYRVGEKVGVDGLVTWSKKMGLGEKTKIELPGEVAGLVPTRLWKERTTGERWFLGNTYHLAIGQGDLTVTPLQVARMTLAAVSGRKCQVSIFKETPVKCEEIGLTPRNIETVREGMRQACAKGGTAFPFFEFRPYVLCKTGTAQHAGQIEEGDLPHAWITVAYPGENPELILTVMLEAAGEGSYEAGPVAKEILEKWRE